MCRHVRAEAKNAGCGIIASVATTKVTVSCGPVISLTAYEEAALSFDHGGHEYATWQAGEGPNLLFIHGFPTASWDWCRIWGPLSWQFRCHAMDMLGFGLSAKPAGRKYLITEQAEAQLALLKSRGVREVHLLAHDYGDTVAQELFARQIEESTDGIAIKSVIFLNGGLFPDLHRPRLIQKLLATPLGPVLSRLLTKRSFEKNFRDIFGVQTQPTDQEIDGFWSLLNRHNGRNVMPALLDYMAQRRTHEERWLQPLISSSVPKRLINGAADPISGHHLAEAYSRIVPNADVVLLDGIGHYPQVEAPQDVLEAVLDFHRQLAQRP